MSIDTSKEHECFVFTEYNSKIILKLKNENIYKNYYKYDEKNHDDFVNNNRYLYTHENLHELFYDKFFKIVNNDQYTKISYFNNMKKSKYDLYFWFF